MLTLLHLSDPHLDGGAERADRLRAALAAGSVRAPDAVVVTGDLTDNGLASELAEFEATMGTGLPRLVVPGNHDRPSEDAGGGGRAELADVTLLDLPDGTRVVGLDVTVPGEDHGHLREDVAARAVEVAEGAPRVLLALHHPPVATGHEVIDGILLDNPEALAALVRTLPPVAAILCGHIHHGLTGSLDGTPVLAAPSTHSLLRVDPRARPITNPDAPPGFAIHRIEGERITTTFHLARESFDASRG